MKKTARENVLIFVEVAIMIALATVLGFIRLFRMPQGGSISLEMVPIFIIALRRGGRVGLVAGGIYGLLQLLIDPYFVHPVQIVLEYPLAFALVGLAGFFKERPWLGFAVGSVARYVVHVVSGMIFFSEYAPEGTPVLIYALTYNAIYILPNLVISGIIVGLLASVVKYRLDH